MNFKPSILLATLGWISVFTLAWLFLLGVLHTSVLSVSIFTIFFIIAVMASAVYGSKPKFERTTDIEVNLNGFTYSEAKGNLRVIHGVGKVFIYPLETVPQETGKKEEKKK